MKKDGIQTRNRKMTSTKSHRRASLSRHVTSSRRSLFTTTTFYDRPAYYQHPATASVFQPGLDTPGFYAAGPYPQYGVTHSYRLQQNS